MHQTYTVRPKKKQKDPSKLEARLNPQKLPRDILTQFAETLTTDYLNRRSHTSRSDSKHSILSIDGYRLDCQQPPGKT